jgi:hypothetical protein
VARDLSVQQLRFADVTGDEKKDIVLEYVLPIGTQWDDAESWEGDAHVWNAQEASFTSLGDSTRVYLTIAGSYSTSAEAMQARKGWRCLEGYGVFRSNDYSKLTKNLFIIAKASFTKEAAQTRLDAARRCVTPSYVKRGR